VADVVPRVRGNLLSIALVLQKW